MKTKGRTSEEKRALRQQITSMAMTLLVVFCSTVVSATMWFQESFDEGLVPTNPYELRLELVKDPQQLAAGDNLLWSSGVQGVASLNTQIPLDGSVSSGHFILTNVYGYESAALYELEVTQGNQSILCCTLESTGKKNMLQKGKSRTFSDVVFSADATQPLQVQLRVAKVTESIYTATTVEELTGEEYPKNSVVYLTQDITTSNLVFEGCYPQVNCNGYTVTCDTFSLLAPAGTYGYMSMGNGRLVVGGKSITESKAISSQGEGNVVFTLFDMK